MIEPLERVRDALRERDCGACVGEKFDCRCPHHDDHDPSLSVAVGGDGTVLLTCHAGCTFEQIVQKLGLEPKDLYPSRNGDGNGRRISDRYVYESADGEPVLRVNRTVPKGFWQERWNGSRWVKGAPPVADRVLFHLPRVLAAIKARDTIHLVEGEKDVLRLEREGLVATTAPGGAKAKWLPQYSESLKGANVIIVADNDEPGKERARLVAKELEGVAATVELKRCPDPYKDASDLLGAGRELGELLPLDEAESDACDSVSAERDRPVTWASSIRKQRMRWTWKGRLALGYLAVWCGAGDLGKSLFACYVIKQLCDGALEGEFEGKPQKALIVATEDGRADMWLPRLEAAGVDLDRVGFLDYPPGWNVRDGVDWIDRAVAGEDVALVLVDALMSHMPDARGSENTRSPTFVRAALEPLADLCKRRSTTVLFGLHPRKAGGESFAEVVQESGAFTQLPRLGLLFGYHPDDVELPRDQQRRVCLRGKGNAGRNPGALSFRISERFLDWEDDPQGIADGIGYVTDVEECHMTEQKLLSRRGQKGQPEGVGKVELAMAVMRVALADGEWHLADPIRAELEQVEANHDEVVGDARRQLGVKSEKQKGIPRGPWWWQMGHSSNLGPLDDSLNAARATLDPQLILSGDSSPNPNGDIKNQRITDSERNLELGFKESRISNSSRARNVAHDVDSEAEPVEDAPQVTPPEDEPGHMYQRVALALERELAHGQEEYNGDVRDRLRAQGLATHPAMISEAEPVLEARGLHLNKKRDFSQKNGPWMWWLTPIEARMALKPTDPPADEKPQGDIAASLVQWNEARP